MTAYLDDQSVEAPRYGMMLLGARVAVTPQLYKLYGMLYCAVENWHMIHQRIYPYQWRVAALGSLLAPS